MLIRVSTNTRTVASALDDLKALTGKHAIWSEFKYSRGMQVFWEGKPAEHLYQIREGAVRTYRLLADGRRQIGMFYLPGDIFGVEIGELHRFSAEAITDTTVWLTGCHNLFEGPTGDDLADSRKIFDLLHQNLQHVQNHMVILGRETALEKLAHFLLEMDRRMKRPKLMLLPMTRRDIGDYLGLSLETVSRSFSRFQDQGILSFTKPRGPFTGQTGRQVVLHNREKLAQLAGGIGLVAIPQQSEPSGR
jgi:CRP/FNR family transcriptional regulator, nitrogen fixation regulation protein